MRSFQLIHTKNHKISGKEVGFMELSTLST